MAALVITVGALIAREGCRGAQALAGGAVAVVLLAFATPAMTLFLVGRGFHISTVLYALLAFAALRRGTLRPGMASGGASDRGRDARRPAACRVRSALVLAGLVTALRQRRWQSAVADVSAAVVGVAVAAASAALVGKRRGAFSSQPASSIVHLGQML